ncbi:MAG: NAD(P)/FAD-dependent oxidoreductase [Candidatus Nanopelagicales bacterium]
MGEILIIGAGPAGLSAARELKAQGAESVTIIERENDAGGIPRHSDHTGYGLRDLKRVMTGPSYARTLVERAQSSGAVIRTGAMVTGWSGPMSAEITSARGREVITPAAIILATGARERPRAARRIPGDRPNGVMTTGQLQNLVHLKHQAVGTRAVVVGAELVSWSAVLTLREVGCSTVAMTTQFDQPESYAALAILGRLALRVPLARRTRVIRVIGRERVEGVEIEQIGTGRRRIVECDTVIFTGDWIPDYELAQSNGLAMDPGSRAPIVDTALRTSREGIFAAGNLLHPVDTADVASLDGVHAARQVMRWLAGEQAPITAARVFADAPFTWISPGLVRTGDVAPARERVLLWSTEYRAFPKIVVRQGARVLSRRTLPWPVSPGRVFRLPWSMIEPARGTEDIRVSLA